MAGDHNSVGPAPMSRPSEFDLIARLFAPLATAPGAFGLKDDVAIIAARAGFDLVVTTDAIVEGVDFFSGDPPAGVAAKALRVNLSDLAAKGAEPAAYLLNLALPRGVDMPWLEDFARGLRDDQARFGITLLGGDTGSTPGPLSVAITAFGHVPQGQMIIRGGARLGDAVFVTGTLGDSGGGLALLKGEAGADLSAGLRAFLIDRYRLPQPPVLFGPALRGIATAAVDVSDGLLADLGHVADASGVRIAVEAARIPISPALAVLWGRDTVSILRAATAGDDYQIAFTAPLSSEAEIAKGAHDTIVTRIGRVESGVGVALLDAAGHEIAVARRGFRHF